MKGADLHAHTTASDGSLTPTELVQLAVKTGLQALAVTDHDTLDGLPEAIAAAETTGIELIPGIELAVTCSTGRFHMLGLFINSSAPLLIAKLELLKANRIQRNERMLLRLNELGMKITQGDLVRESGGGQIGRPHFAAAMMRKGYVSSMQDAFTHYLADGSSAHVPKVKITPEEGIELIHSAGGIASIAHPLSLKLEGETLMDELYRLKSLGLDAVECYYNLHTTAQNSQFASMAARAGLLATGGSDFHGTPKPDVKLGHVILDEPLPMDVVEQIRP